MVSDSIREEEPMRAAPARNFGGPLFSTRCQEELVSCRLSFYEGCYIGGYLPFLQKVSDRQIGLALKRRKCVLTIKTWMNFK
jgi:hypothetical protein